jgi:hypothetical protein
VEYFAGLKKNSGGISANSGPEFRLLGTAVGLNLRVKKKTFKN